MVVLAGNLDRAAKLVTVFVVGHSTTLVGATLAGVRVDPRWVDVVIALSIVYVGIVAMGGWLRERWHWVLFGLGVLGFGFVHGLGLSARLQGLGLPEDGLLPRVIAFNVGIEIGQLSAITVVVLTARLAFAVSGRPAGLRRPAVARWSRLGLAAVGTVAAAVLAKEAIEGIDPYDQMLAGTSRVCQVHKRDAAPMTANSGPEKAFYPPTEPAPEQEFDGLVEAGDVVVHYRTNLSRGEWEQIESVVDAVDGVAAGPVPDQSPAMIAVTQRRVLTCEAVDVEALVAFRELWSTERARA